MVDPDQTSSHASENLEFLRQRHSTAHSYFIHIENNLARLVTFYSTLFVASISAYYYILVSNAFKDFRPYFIAIAAVVFFLLGLFILHMYVELRIRKIRILEQIARIDEFFAQNDTNDEPNIDGALVMIKGIKNCPPYLRRPSEDWYATLLMIFLNSLACAFGISVLASAFESQAATYIFLGVLTFMYVFSRQFSRMTVRTFDLDCDRVETLGYDFFPKRRELMHLLLKWLDSWASAIERKHKKKRTKSSN